MAGVKVMNAQYVENLKEKEWQFSSTDNRCHLDLRLSFVH